MGFSMLKPHYLLLVCGLLCLWSSPAVAGEAILSWNAVNDPTVLGYNVYYGTASHTYGEPVNVGNQTTHTVTGLASGTYYFAVTAYNSVGESGFSNEVSKPILSNNGGGGGGCGTIRNVSDKPGQSPGQFVVNLVPLVLILIISKLKWLLKASPWSNGMHHHEVCTICRTQKMEVIKPLGG